MNISLKKLQILVPLDLERSHDIQLSYAIRMAQRFDAELLLLHVLSEGEADKSMNKATADGSKDLIESAHETLGRIVSTLPEGLIGTRIVNVCKSPSLGILETASSYGVDLVVCGVASVSHRFLPNALSTVLNTMSRSHLPVVAIPPESWASLQSKAVRVVIADDLSEECAANVKLAMTWCSRAKDCEVHHIHVNKMDREEFVNAYYASSAAYQVAEADGYDPGAAYDTQQKLLENRLGNRMSELKIERPKNLKSYQTTLLIGSVSDQVFELARSVDADLLFFGKHHAFDVKHLALGKIPYRDMLQERFPVVITPNDWVFKAKATPAVAERREHPYESQNHADSQLMR